MKIVTASWKRTYGCQSKKVDLLENVNFKVVE